MKLIKLITARPEYTMFGKGILCTELIYNNDFLSHLFIKGIMKTDVSKVQKLAAAWKKVG